MAENYGMVGGLYSNARYLFWVEAIVLELEGSLQTTGVVTARNATIFVPGESTSTYHSPDKKLLALDNWNSYC